MIFREGCWRYILVVCNNFHAPSKTCMRGLDDYNKWIDFVSTFERETHHLTYFHVGFFTHKTMSLQGYRRCSQALAICNFTTRNLPKLHTNASTSSLTTERFKSTVEWTGPVWAVGPEQRRAVTLSLSPGLLDLAHLFMAFIPRLEPAAGSPNSEVLIHCQDVDTNDKWGCDYCFFHL